MEFLLSRDRLFHLEKQTGIRSTPHSLIGKAPHLPRPFQTVIGLPVLLIRRLFHQHKGLSSFQPPHQIVLHCSQVKRILQKWVIVPACHIQIFYKDKLIQLLYISAHISGNRPLWIIFPDRFIFIKEALCRAVCYEPHIIQRSGLMIPVVIIKLGRKHDLLKAGSCSSPESRIPFFIQCFYAFISFFQPYTKFCLTFFTITVCAVFIGYMPHDHSRMSGIALCHFLCDSSRTLPVF